MGLNATKRYTYKIYDSSGNYLKTLSDVENKYPTFTTAINGGVGELVLDIARRWKDMQNCTDLVLYNELRVLVNDKDSNKVQIYSGYLNKITRTKNEAGMETVKCSFVGYVSEFALRILEFNSGYTALQYASADPSDILKSFIDLYAGKITYTGASIDATGNTVTLIFNANTIREAIDRMLTTCPIGWYWYVGGDNIIYLKRTNKESIDHRLHIGSEINGIEVVESMENVRNDVLVVGGTPDGVNKMYSRYYNTASQNEFGKRLEVKNDGRLYDQSSIDFIGKYLLGTQYPKEYEFRFKVIDSNYSAKGYDIESISPGDIIKIYDPKTIKQDTLWDVAIFDVDYWDYNVESPFCDPLIVEEIRYNGIDCEISASRLLRGIGFRLADVKRNLENYLNAETPATPATSEETTFSYNSSGDLSSN